MIEELRVLLADAAALYRDNPRAAAVLHECLDRLGEPVRVGFSGARGTGKSTLAAALGEWPTRALRDLTLLDDPGPGAYADATVQLVRHLEPDELATACQPAGSALGQQGLGRQGFGRQSAVNVVLVLSRADEVGAGRIDALLTARQLARRSWREDPLCAGFQGVIAVAGQLAYAGRALQDDEFAALAALATVPRADLERHLLSVDSFVGEPFPVALSPDARRVLLARFGLYGVRLATTLVRTGCDNRIKLSAELVRRSGLGELRDTIAGCFAARADALKARTALLRLENLLQAEPRPHSDRLAARVERFVATTHDFAELRLIADIRGGRTALDPEAVRLLGAEGGYPAERLGLSPDSEDEEIYAAGLVAVQRWRHDAERLDATPAERAAARVVVRSVEGVLALFG